jgi:hypothetical protein
MKRFRNLTCFPVNFRLSIQRPPQNRDRLIPPPSFNPAASASETSVLKKITS